MGPERGAGRMLDERFLRILKIFKWGRDSEKALEVLRVKVDTTLVRHVLSDPDTEIQVKLSFFKWASARRHFHHDPYAYMALVRSLHRSHMFSHMWTAARSMLINTPSLDPHHFSELVNLFTESHMVDQALTLFHHTLGSAPSPTRHANSLFSALLCSARPDRVVQLYSQLSSADPAPISPNVATYRLLLSAYRRLGPERAPSAVRLFQEMKENRLQPDAMIYTTMIRIFFDSGEAGRGLALLEEMSAGGVRPTVFTYTEVIRGLGGAGRDEEAYRMFLAAAEVVRPDAVMINSVLEVLGRAGRAEEAVGLFEGMGRAFGARRTVVTYNTMIKAAFRHGGGRGVAEWVGRMAAEGVAGSGHTFSILVDGFCRSNRVEEAVRMVEEREERGEAVPAATYCSVIGALGRCGRWEAAEEMFREVAEGAEGAGASSRVYAVMIKHLGRRGRMEEAVRLFAAVREEGAADVYAYNALMAGLVRGGRVEEAVGVMERMVEEGGCSPDLNTHNILLNGFARCGGPRRALDMLARMKDSAAVRPDVVSYNTVLGCLARAGLLEEAAGLMKEMREVGVQYDRLTYKSVLEAVGTVDEPCSVE